MSTPLANRAGARLFGVGAVNRTFPTWGERLQAVAATRTRPNLIGSIPLIVATKALYEGKGDGDLTNLRSKLFAKCGYSLAKDDTYEAKVAVYPGSGSTTIAAARQARRTIECCIMAWWLAGSEMTDAMATAYRDRAVEEVVALMAWPDWQGYSSKISCAEITIAAATALEWLSGNGLTADQETSLVTAIATKGMVPLRDAFYGLGDISQFDTQPGLKVYYPANRTGTITAAAIVGALALCVYPEYATAYASVLDAARINIARYMEAIYAEGPLREGPAYAAYGDPHIALSAAVVGQATNGSVELEIPNYGLGIKRACRWLLSTAGFTKRYTTHSACSEYAETHCLCYAGAAHFEPDAQADATYQLIRAYAQASSSADFDSSRSHLALMYWSQMQTSSLTTALDLIVRWDTSGEFIVRSDRTSTAMVTWLYGGGEPRPKWKRDLGTFGFDWAGLRWVYVESDYNDSSKTGRANTMQFGSDSSHLAEQPEETSSSVAVAAGTWSPAHSDFVSGVGCYDFAAAKPVYPNQIQVWRRQLAKLSASAIQLTDTWVPLAAGVAWRWGMYTYATYVSGANGRELKLTLGGKTIYAYIVTEGPVWTSGSLHDGIVSPIANAGPTYTGSAIYRWEITGTATANAQQQLIVRFWGDGADSIDYRTVFGPTVAP